MKAEKALSGRTAWNGASCVGDERIMGTTIAAEVLVARSCRLLWFRAPCFL